MNLSRAGLNEEFSSVVGLKVAFLAWLVVRSYSRAPPNRPLLGRTQSPRSASRFVYLFADRRWRAERNFYISFMFLSCSVLANRVRLLLKEMDSLHEQIREIRKR